MSSVETIDRSSHKPDARPVTRPGIPSRHHHLAYSTHDTRATIEFYTRVMGMALVDAVIDDRIPSTNDAYTYLHTFFRMEDGSCLAFFESPGVPEMPPIEHPAHWIFNDLRSKCRNGKTSTGGATGLPPMVSRCCGPTTESSTAFIFLIL